MIGKPKQNRSYHSPHRARRARATRRAVLESARRLFAERGYAGATIDQIAEGAGVSPETVYATFGNKRTLLGESVRVAVSGDESVRSLLTGEGLQWVHGAADQRELLRRFAHDITGRIVRVAPLMEVVAAAAKTDSELATLHDDLQTGRMANLRVIVEWLAELGPLRVGVDEAATTAWVLAGPDVYRSLTEGQGWSPARFEEWLAAGLDRLLLSR